MNEHQTDLVEAIRAGDGEVARRLLVADPDLAAARDGSGLSLLMLALYHRQPAIAGEMARLHPELDLFEASALGNLGRVAALLSADPGQLASIAPDGFTPLHLAAYFGQLEVVQALLAAGAQPNSVAANPSRVTPLHGAAAGRHHSVIEALLAAGADPDAVQEGGFTALHAARLHHDEGMAALLLAAGADPDRPMPDRAG